MARSRAHANLPKLSPLLYATLVPLELLPYRRSWRRRRRYKRRGTGSIACSLLPPHGRLIVRQRMRSSVSLTAEKNSIRGKIRSGRARTRVVFFLVAPSVGPITTLSGCHKSSHRRWPGLPTFMCVSTEAISIQSDDCGEPIDIPPRKPRKSHKPPNPPWSAEQKAANTVLSRVRIFSEHAIGGMKRSNILVHTFRHRIKHFEDDAIGICAGLWNLVLSY